MPDGSPLAHSPTLAATAPREDDEAQLGPGARIGEYVVERFIGAGAMGEVYAGRHPVIGKRVALKVLRHELTASAEAAERFIREARAVNQIEHENVVDVFGFGRLDDGRLYLAMDLVEGRSLRAHLVDGPLELGRALDILDAVASALDAAHARGVVHRDLKPDNIVLSNASPPKVFVLDFGIAKLISTASANAAPAPGTLTGQGTWLGTPAYMAPEQWSADGAGPASDRYALGVIAYELLAGAPPFSASSAPAMMEQHFRAEVPPLSAREAVDVPDAVDAVMKRALAKDPDARYPSARAFVDALRRAAGQATSPSRDAIADRGVVRKRWVAAAVSAGVLGIAIAVVMVTRQERTAARQASSGAAAPPGMVKLSIASVPSGAEVRVGGHARGTTPVELEARSGDTMTIAIAKPGYLPVERTVTAGESTQPIHATLAEVTSFAGTWRLPDGQLRELRRAGDRVEVFKRTAAVGGETTFFKHYDFVRAERGIAFGAEDEIVDPRAPNDPRCHVRVRVEYRYDPGSDVLEQHREKVKIGFRDGSCVVQSREVEPARLVRVDARPDAVDAVELRAPVGRLDQTNSRTDTRPEPGEQNQVVKETPKPPPAKRRTKQAPSKRPAEPTKARLAPASIEVPAQQKAPPVEKVPPARQNVVEPQQDSYTPPPAL